MNDLQRWIVGLALLAGIGQMAVPPHRLVVRNITGGGPWVIYRWYPSSGVEDLYFATDAEEERGVDSVVFVRAAELAMDRLAIQLGTTALAAGLFLLLAGGKKREPDLIAPEPDSP